MRHDHKKLWNLLKVKLSQYLLEFRQAGDLLLHFWSTILDFCNEVWKLQTRIPSKQKNTFALSPLVTLLLLRTHTHTSVVCHHLTDESGGGALSNPEAELPLLPLPQFSLSTGGDEHRVLVYQRLMKDLKAHRLEYTCMFKRMFIQSCASTTLTTIYTTKIASLKGELWCFFNPNPFFPAF